MPPDAPRDGRDRRPTRCRSAFAAVVSAGLLAALVALSARPAAAFEARTGWTAFFRAGPGYQYAVTDELEPNAAVDVLACSGDWCRVTSQRVVGYLPSDLLFRDGKPVRPPTAQAASQTPSSPPASPAAPPAGAVPVADAQVPCFLASRSLYYYDQPMRFCPR